MPFLHPHTSSSNYFSPAPKCHRNSLKSILNSDHLLYLLLSLKSKICFNHFFIKIGSSSALPLCTKFHYILQQPKGIHSRYMWTHFTGLTKGTRLTAPDPEISMAATVANTNVLQLTMFLFLKALKLNDTAFLLHSKELQLVHVRFCTEL